MRRTNSVEIIRKIKKEGLLEQFKNAVSTDGFDNVMEKLEALKQENELQKVLNGYKVDIPCNDWNTTILIKSLNMMNKLTNLIDIWYDLDKILDSLENKNKYEIKFLLENYERFFDKMSNFISTEKDIYLTKDQKTTIIAREINSVSTFMKKNKIEKEPFSISEEKKILTYAINRTYFYKNKEYHFGYISSDEFIDAVFTFAPNYKKKLKQSYKEKRYYVDTGILKMTSFQLYLENRLKSIKKSELNKWKTTLKSEDKQTAVKIYKDYLEEYIGLCYLSKGNPDKFDNSTWLSWFLLTKVIPDKLQRYVEEIIPNLWYNNGDALSNPFTEDKNTWNEINIVLNYIKKLEKEIDISN